MDNATTLPAYVDPDPESALYMGIWFTCLAVSGIPLNVFIVVSTLAVKELRSIPANAFIGSLALGDTLFLLSFMLHLPYAVTSNEIICKVTGLGIYTFGLLISFKTWKDNLHKFMMESFYEKAKEKLHHAAVHANEFVHMCVTADRIRNTADSKPVLRGDDVYIDRYSRNRLSSSAAGLKHHRHDGSTGTYH
uniref:G-protein coupled receptors family 1 profile domain-containing protein n=1 Tax=Plectus sambesii TaxID=2011161 RepID=A0A914XGS3_9BILA